VREYMRTVKDEDGNIQVIMDKSDLDRALEIFANCEPETLATVKTIYTVLPHCGAHIEVPEGTKVTFYDPKTRGDWVK
jgi:hypothetical protein